MPAPKPIEIAAQQFLKSKYAEVALVDTDDRMLLPIRTYTKEIANRAARMEVHAALDVVPENVSSSDLANAVKDIILKHADDSQKARVRVSAPRTDGVFSKSSPLPVCGESTTKVHSYHVYAPAQAFEKAMTAVRGKGIAE